MQFKISHKESSTLKEVKLISKPYSTGETVTDK